ncbi:hypothetical protein [Veillonella parvula]|uniref:hypothetical protein n=1 Tax=Veillonella parvula TaxID=29466 RepID=UPI00195F427E|nr:hypothetical protein [Veillonella parvula]VTY47483.1 Uncharacterised protein [Veillonella parvula]
MNMPPKLINVLKKSYQSIRVAKVHPTLVWGARILIFIMLTPIILATMAYAISFYLGEISSANDKIITMGAFLIDHMFGAPGVIVSLTGLLWLSVDRDNNGIPDKLEEQPKIQPLSNITERSDYNAPR